MNFEKNVFEKVDETFKTKKTGNTMKTVKRILDR